MNKTLLVILLIVLLMLAYQLYSTWGTLELPSMSPELLLVTIVGMFICLLIVTVMFLLLHEINR